MLPFQRSRLASLAPASYVSDGAIKEKNLHWPNTKNTGFNTWFSFNIKREQRVQTLTFLLALRRSALRLAFSSSLSSSSPLIAPWNTPDTWHVRHTLRRPSPEAARCSDTVCLPGTKWYHRWGQRWRHHSPSAPPAAGQGCLWRDRVQPTVFGAKCNAGN